MTAPHPMMTKTTSEDRCASGCTRPCSSASPHLEPLSTPIATSLVIQGGGVALGTNGLSILGFGPYVISLVVPWQPCSSLHPSLSDFGSLSLTTSHRSIHGHG